MKILVAIKRVIDYRVPIRVDTERQRVVTDNVKMSMNPFDEIALEEAIRFKEKGWANDIIAVSVGQKEVTETLRQALALGADSAIHLEYAEPLIPIDMAHVLKEIVLSEKVDCVFMGKQAIDGDNNQTGQMLAGLLGWSQATFVSELILESGNLTATREVDGGLETIVVKLPAVITTDLRLNTPRYASLPNIMQAKQKPLRTIKLEAIIAFNKKRQIVEKVELPPVRQKGIILDSVEDLIGKLKNEKGINLTRER